MYRLARPRARSDSLDDKALYLSLTVIVFALSLFALTLAQITKRSVRRLFLISGAILMVAAVLTAAGVGLFLV